MWGSYCLALFENMEQSRVYCLSLDAQSRLIHSDLILEGDDTGWVLNAKEFIRMVLRRNAINIVLAHNRLDGDYLPTPRDITLNDTISTLLNPLDIKLLDHIIVCGTQFYTFTRNNLRIREPYYQAGDLVAEDIER